jgi:hypothetical protein
MKQSMTEYWSQCLSLVGYFLTLSAASRRDYMVSMMGWLINVEQLVKWEYVRGYRSTMRKPAHWRFLYHRLLTIWKGVGHGPPWSETGGYQPKALHGWSIQCQGTESNSCFTLIDKPLTVMELIWHRMRSDTGSYVNYAIKSGREAF